MYSQKEQKLNWYFEFKERGIYMTRMINEVIASALENKDYKVRDNVFFIYKDEPKPNIYTELDCLYSLTIFLDFPLDYRLTNTIGVRDYKVIYNVIHLEKVEDTIHVIMNVKNHRHKIKRIHVIINKTLTILIR